MALGQTTYDAALNPTVIHEVALQYLRDDFRVANFVTVKNDRQGLLPRKGARWTSLGYRQIATTDDVVSEQLTRDALGTLTPAIYANAVFIADEDVKTETLEDLIGGAGREFGQGAVEHVETNLVTNFSSFTGGTIGSAGTAITWGHFWAMRTRLSVQAKNSNKPWVFVCHPYQWHLLAKAADTAGIAIVQANFPSPEMATAWGIKQVDDVVIVPTPYLAIDSTDDAVTGMFQMEALALDWRTPFDGVRPERDESKGGGGTELNAMFTYAHGIWDASQGIKGTFDATAPTS